MSIKVLKSLAAFALGAALATTSRPEGAHVFVLYIAVLLLTPAEWRRRAASTLALAAMALHYFETSEQLRCQVHLACARTDAGWRAGALVLERIAGAGGIDPTLDAAAQEESWRAATALAATLTDAELLDDDLAPERLLYRLFHTEGVAADRARSLSYGCRCSRARLAGILETFGGDDLDHMAVGSDIVMTCEFCNYDFRFPRAEVRGAGGAARQEGAR